MMNAETRRDIRELSKKLYDTANTAIYNVLNTIVARVVGIPNPRPRTGSTPIGQHGEYLHGLLLGNWRMSVSDKSDFNDDDYHIGREEVYNRLMSYAGPKDYMIGKTFYLTNATPYALEIDEATDEDKKYQAPGGMIPMIAMSLSRGLPRTLFKRLAWLGYEVDVDLEYNAPPGYQAGKYQGKKHMPADNAEWGTFYEKLRERNRQARLNPFHPDSIASATDRVKAYKRQDYNLRKRIGAARKRATQIIKEEEERKKKETR